MLWKIIIPLAIVINNNVEAKTIRNNHSALINLSANFVEMLQKQQDTLPYSAELSLCWRTEERSELFHLLQRKSIFCELNNNDTSISNVKQQIKIMDFGCPISNSIFEKYFKVPFQSNWLILNFPSDDYINDFFADWKIGPDSNVFLVLGLKNGSYKIISPYKINESSKHILLNDIAMFSEQRGFVYFNYLSVSQNRTDLMGLLMNVSFVLLDNDTLNHLTDYRDKHLDAITKYNYLLMRTISTYLNFTIREFFQSTWGYKIPNSTLFTGMIGDLQIGKAEIGGTPAFIDTNRIKLIEYVSPTTPTYIKFIFKAPRLSYVSNIFILPFDKFVWISCFILIPIIVVFLYIIANVEQNFKRGNSFDPQELRPNLLDNLHLTIAAIFQQGCESNPKSLAGRIATLFVFVAFMFMFTSYSANIVVLLQSTTESIRNNEDLLKSKMVLSADNTPFMRYYFQRQTEPTRVAIYNKMMLKSNVKDSFLDINTGIKKMQQGFFAFHTEESRAFQIIAETFQEHEKCSLVCVAYWSINEPWLAIKKKSTFNELLKIGFKKLHERGIQNREYRILYTKKPVCSNKGGNFKSIGFLDCYNIIIMYVSGIGMATFILITEKITNLRNSGLGRDLKSMYGA